MHTGILFAAGIEAMELRDLDTSIESPTDYISHAVLNYERTAARSRGCVTKQLD